MTTPVSTAQPRRVQVQTTDDDILRQFLADLYGDNVRMSGRLCGHRFQFSQADAGPFALTSFTLPVDLSFCVDPLDALFMVYLTAGGIERACGGASERFRSGDLFISSQPGCPLWSATHAVESHTARLDPSVLTQVAATAPARQAGPIRFTGYRPVSTSAAEHWEHTHRYLSELTTNPEAVLQPLVIGNAARLLAATALTVFPNTAVTDPTAQDRRDTSAVTLRRAIAFIEEHADRDIGPADIACAARISLRAVQLAFRRHLDTTPTAYLRRVRLDNAHRDLICGDPQQTTVAAIATRWGFANHSRFATYYRATYNALPSRTLRGDA